MRRGEWTPVSAVRDRGAARAGTGATRAGSIPTASKPAGWAPPAGGAPPTVTVPVRPPQSARRRPGPAPAAARPRAAAARDRPPAPRQVGSSIDRGRRRGRGVAAIGGVAWCVLGRSHSSTRRPAADASTLPPRRRSLVSHLPGPTARTSSTSRARRTEPESLPPRTAASSGRAGPTTNAFDPRPPRLPRDLAGVRRTVARPDQLRAASMPWRPQFATDPGRDRRSRRPSQGYPARRFSITVDGDARIGRRCSSTDTHVYLIMSGGSDARRPSARPSRPSVPA